MKRVGWLGFRIFNDIKLGPPPPPNFATSWSWKSCHWSAIESNELKLFDCNFKNILFEHDLEELGNNILKYNKHS